MLGNIPLPLPQKTIYFSAGMQMYMGQYIKRPLLDAIRILSDPNSSRLDKLRMIKKFWVFYKALKGLPVPTKENTWHPNSHGMIEIRDWFFEHCKFKKERLTVIWWLMNFIIVLYDFDPPWRWALDNVKDEALKRQWKPRGFQDTWQDQYEWWQE